MTDTLLDFGNSLWSGPDLIDVFPSLAATSYEPTGKFGIGFFSVLMWGDHVTVASRPMRASVEGTFVLELSDGVSSRPLVRPASEAELQGIAAALRRAGRAGRRPAGTGRACACACAARR